MFARVFALLPLALLASASHLEARDQCNTGSISCCNSVQTVNDASSVLSFLNLLSLASDVGGLVGLSCTTVGSSGCEAQPVCCENNEYNGLVNIGCSPISIL